MTFTFPIQSSRFILPGTSNALEVAVELPEQLMPDVPIFVMCHPHPLMGGTMDNKVVTTTCKAMNQQGIPTVRFNYRGVGKSEGSYGNVSGECDDLASIVAWVKDHQPQRPIWLGGFSFGSFIAYKMSNSLGVAKLLSIAPAVHVDNYPITAEPTMPWMLVVPDADEVVNVADTFSWLAQVKCSYHLIKLSGVSHFFHGQLLLLKTELLRHFKCE